MTLPIFSLSPLTAQEVNLLLEGLSMLPLYKSRMLYDKIGMEAQKQSDAKALVEKVGNGVD